MPSILACHLHIEKRTLPGTEKGKNNHKNAIKALTTNSLLTTCIGGNFVTYKKMQAIKKAAAAANTLFKTAMVQTINSVEITLALGSALCKKEFP